MATAKRDAAKRGLYSKFFRGPVLGPDTMIEEEKHLAALVSQASSANDPIAEMVSVKKETTRIKSSKTKRKSRETKESGTEDEDEEAKRERKKRRKEKNEKKEKKAGRHAPEKKHRKEKLKQKTEDMEAESSPPPISQKDQKIEGFSVVEMNRFSGDETDNYESQADRKRRKKEEKKRLKILDKGSGQGCGEGTFQS